MFGMNLDQKVPRVEHARAFHAEQFRRALAEKDGCSARRPFPIPCPRPAHDKTHNPVGFIVAGFFDDRGRFFLRKAVHQANDREDWSGQQQRKDQEPDQVIHVEKRVQHRFTQRDRATIERRTGRRDTVETANRSQAGPANVNGAVGRLQ